MIIEKFSDILQVAMEGDHVTYNEIIQLQNDQVFAPTFSRTSNIGFKLGHFLWVIRGTNNLKDLNYYSKHVDILSDDTLTLRGALGTRMRYWVGADQFQEAININQDISNQEDFVKPTGVDQLRACYDDLQDGDLPMTTMSFFDPAIDFDATNDVPDLMSVSFIKNGDKLDATLFYNCFDPLFNAFNEIHTLRLIQCILASWLVKELGSFTIHAAAFKHSNIEKLVYYPDLTNKVDICQDDMMFWNDIEHLSYFERHMKFMVNEDTMNNPEVAVGQMTESLNKVVVSQIQEKFWIDYAHLLMIWSIKKYARQTRVYEDFILETFNKMEGVLQQECAFWLEIQGGNPSTLKHAMNEVLQD